MDPKVPYQFRLNLSVAHGETTLSPPGTREDGFGNSISIAQPARDKVRIEDNQGGFAEIHWDGKQFVVDQSKPSKKSVAARGPSAGAIQLANVGGLCFALAPALCWLFLALFLRVYRREQAKSTTGASASFLFQLVGVVLGVFELMGFDRAGPGNEIPLTPFLTILASGLGLLLLTFQWRSTKDNWLASPSVDE